MHELTAMTYRGRIPHKSAPTATFKSGKNIWFVHYNCAVCGRKHRIHANFHPPDKSPWCDGRNRVQWIPKEEA